MLQIGDWIFDGKTLDYIKFPYSRDNPYWIEKETLFDSKMNISWVQHLKSKVWFDAECETSFIEILEQIKNMAS